MKRALSFLVWVRRTLGAAVAVGVVVVILHSQKPVALAANATLVDEGPMPDLGGAVGWLNSEPLSRKSLRGKVVLVDFWTYTCINSLRPLPYVKSWAAKYKDAGLVVIGAHTPEFSFEHEPLKENGATGLASGTTSVSGVGIEAAPDGRMGDLRKHISDIARRKISPRPKKCIKIPSRYSVRPGNFL